MINFIEQMIWFVGMLVKYLVVLVFWAAVGTAVGIFVMYVLVAILKVLGLE